MRDARSEVTQLLTAWNQGDEGAKDRLVPLVYRELHQLAQRYMAKEYRGHTLQATALVNEAYLRLVDIRHADWRNQAHFFAVAARIMRHVLVDLARQRGRLKRGAEEQRVSFEEALTVKVSSIEEVLAIDEALDKLAATDPRKVQVVELRFFAGLSVEETAKVLKASTDTVLRDWRLAKLWLRRELRRQSG
jgi:RNA polymerase sigma-70 factor, ECF subfamily